MSPSTAAITSSLPEEKQGVASALKDTVRVIGGAVGIGLLGSVLNASFRSDLKAATSTLPSELADRASGGMGGALATRHRRPARPRWCWLTAAQCRWRRRTPCTRGGVGR